MKGREGGGVQGCRKWIQLVMSPMSRRVMMKKPLCVTRKASNDLQDDGGDYMALAQSVAVLCLRGMRRSAQHKIEMSSFGSVLAKAKEAPVPGSSECPAEMG
eukprot:6174022-Pleurochrysis_carterae.AAC.1